MLAGRITRGTSEGARYDEPEFDSRCTDRLDTPAVARCSQLDLDRLCPRAVRGYLELHRPADTERLSFDPANGTRASEQRQRNARSPGRSDARRWRRRRA